MDQLAALIGEIELYGLAAQCDGEVDAVFRAHRRDYASSGQRHYKEVLPDGRFNVRSAGRGGQDSRAGEKIRSARDRVCRLRPPGGVNSE